MFIEIKGVQFVNKGAELMLLAVISKVSEIWPDAKIVLKHNSNSPYEKRAKLGAYQKLEWKMKWLERLCSEKFLKKLISRYGLVSDKYISITLDASGFAYGDQWGRRGVKNLCRDLKESSVSGKKYFLLPQAFGPFSDKIDKALLTKALPLAAMVCARERSSYSSIESISSSINNLYLYPDFTNLLEGHCPDYYKNGEKKVLIIPNSNMISSRNENKGWVDVYLEKLNEVVQVITAKGLEPVLLNHEGSGDAEICRQLNELNGQRMEMIFDDNPLHVKGIIGASAAVISSRFHACVSALCQGVPCLGTSWSHKYERLFEDYNKGDYIISPTLDLVGINKMFDRAFVKSGDEHQKYLESIQLEKQRAEEMWKKISNEFL